MAVRLKSRWHRSKRSERNKKGSRAPKTLMDLTRVIGINIWKLARECFIRMEKEGFRFREDTQAIEFIEELLVFQLHIVDRMLYQKIEDAERADFVNGVAKHLGASLADNQYDLMGSSQVEGVEFVASFKLRINERSANYADCDFTEEGPSYPMLRYLAHNIADVLSATDDKWVVEQIMDIEAPEVIDRIMPVVDQLLGLKNLSVNQLESGTSSKPN